jgi:hypothetical protein
MSFREDYVIRMIRQVAEFVAKIAGYTTRRQYESAIDEAGRAWDELLDVPRALVDRIDGPTLARLLKEPGRMRVAAELLVAEGKAYAGKQDPVHAMLCFRRALELYLEARALEPLDADDAAIFDLGRIIPPNEIDPRYTSES